MYPNAGLFVTSVVVLFLVEGIWYDGEMLKVGCFCQRFVFHAQDENRETVEVSELVERDDKV